MDDYKQSKGFEDLMFGVKHRMSKDYIIECLKTIELEKLLKDLKKTEKKIEKIRNEYFKKE